MTEPMNQKMDKQQSFLLNDIKKVLRNGSNVTHILNVKLSCQCNNETGTSILQAIFRKIANKCIRQQVQGVFVDITWRTSAASSSAYYHADVCIYNDLAVKLHTKQLLHSLLTEIDAQFGHFFENGTTELAFIVSKPLTKVIPLNDDDVI